MKKNIGTTDRIVRLILGMLLISSVFIVSGGIWLKIALGVFGLFVIAEAVSGWCVLYKLLGRNTCPVE